MKSSHVRNALAEVCLRLGYEPNRAGLYSFRKYSIATVVREVGIDKGTRQAQHSKVTSTTVNSTYDNTQLTRAKVNKLILLYFVFLGRCYFHARQNNLRTMAKSEGRLDEQL
jgi:hypothetical protein